MRRTPLITAAAALALVGSTFAPAQAAEPTGKVLANDLNGPLSLAVARNGNVFTTESFGGELTRITPKGKQKVLWSSKTLEVAGVSVKSGVLSFVTTNYETGAAVVRQRVDGKVRTLADLGAHEAEVNPDGDQEYGFLDLSEECEAEFPADGPPASYSGEVFSHPYATASHGDTLYVADAGANSILAVSPDGSVSSVAILPSVPLTVPPGMAEQFDFPSCVEGHDYHLEGVPTDIEVAHDGDLFVTSLPGGPEGVAPNGSVFEIDMPSGTVSRVATGFFAATGLALAPNGDLYVAELFGSKVSKVPFGASTPESFVTGNQTAAVEIRDGRLYVSSRAMTPKGKITRYGL